MRAVIADGLMHVGAIILVGCSAAWDRAVALSVGSQKVNATPIGT